MKIHTAGGFMSKNQLTELTSDHNKLVVQYRKLEADYANATAAKDAAIADRERLHAKESLSIDFVKLGETRNREAKDHIRALSERDARIAELEAKVQALRVGVAGE